MVTISDSFPTRDTYDTVGGRSYRRTELIGPVLCSLALIASIVIANPFVDSSFNDDWSYSDTALKLAQTGRIHYNGWGSPTILFQSAWAALFIRLYGFSFDLLRVIAIPFSVGFVCLTYFLGRRLGLHREFAGFAALTVGVSPLFVPLAASFMTEPYACFFSLLCIYAAVHSVTSRSESSAVRWLWVLTISGILGGSDRQTVWFLPLLILPYLAWLRRSNVRFLLQCVAAYAACLASLGFVLLHFHTGYAVSDMSRKQWLLVAYANSRDGIHYIVSVLLVTALMCLPALVCITPLCRRLGSRTVGVILALCLITFDYVRSGLGDLLGVAPFLGNILTLHGVLDEFTGLGTRPKVLHIYERYPITFLLLFSIAVWIYLLKTRFARLTLPPAIARIFLIFAVPYICLLLPGATLGFCYDRYALMLLPLAAVCVLLPLQELLNRIPVVGWAALMAFAGYGIATTHDYARYLQARTTAVELSRKKGISRMHISAGVEHDGWTQVQTANRIGHALYGLKVGSYNNPWFSFFATSVRPDYVTYSSPRAKIPPGAVVTVPYSNWLPPSHQAVSVLKPATIPKPLE
ncbi:MAG: ArnT family glycosyltransferase [Bryobacteraceae bacterium]